MKLNIKENKPTRLVFDIEGADHTFCNVLKEELKQIESVVVVTYNISHPLQGIPRFIVETKGEKPVDAIQKAIKSLKKKNADFVKAFSSLV